MTSPEGQNSGGFVEIGHAILACPRCDQPRHVPIEAICRPTAGPDTKSWRAMLNGEQVGQIYLAVRHRPDGHRCDPNIKPAKGLRLVRQEETTWPTT